MAQPPNSNKYDSLLNQFLKDDNLLVEDESQQMERWLEEAANSLRSQFKRHRGDAGHINSIVNEDKIEPNVTKELEAAMCLSLPSDSSDEELHEGNQMAKKRSRENYLSEIEMPLPKRMTTDHLFLNDILSLDMISLSSSTMNKDLNNKTNNAVASSCSEKNVFGFIGSTYSLGCQNSDSIFGQVNGTSIIPKLTSADTSVTLKESNEPPKYSDINMDNKLIVSQAIPGLNGNSSSCIWPSGISYQPEFIEIVVTDEEMNAYWNTIEHFF